MIKKYAKRTIGILALIGAVAAYVFFMQATVTNRDDIEFRNLRGFYMEKPDTLDVVIMGSSEVMNGYSAGVAYRDAGYTSYPYAFTINSDSLWKYELEDIERTQHPQILLIETNGALYEEDKYVYNEHCINALGESMPMSMNRIRLAFEMSDEPMERLFPIIKFHYKWKDILNLSENSNMLLLKSGHARLRGLSCFMYRQEYSTEMKYPPDGTTADLNPNAEKELIDFLEVCKGSDIELIVFVEFPHIMGSKDLYERQQRANRAAEIIQEAGFDYIDLTEASDEMGFDYDNDFYDEHHLRGPGQVKLTRYIAGLVTDKYGLTPKEQTEENRAEWEDSARLMDTYYQVYDDYIREHADDPYAKADHVLGENVKSMKLIRDKEAEKGTE